MVRGDLQISLHYETASRIVPNDDGAPSRKNKGFLNSMPNHLFLPRSSYTSLGYGLSSTNQSTYGKYISLQHTSYYDQMAIWTLMTSQLCKRSFWKPPLVRHTVTALVMFWISWWEQIAWGSRIWKTSMVKLSGPGLTCVPWSSVSVNFRCFLVDGSRQYYTDATMSNIREKMKRP